MISFHGPFVPQKDKATAVSQRTLKPLLKKSIASENFDKWWLNRVVHWTRSTHTPCSSACRYVSLYTLAISRRNIARSYLSHAHRRSYCSQSPFTPLYFQTLHISHLPRLCTSHLVDSVLPARARSVYEPSTAPHPLIPSFCHPLLTRNLN